MKRKIYILAALILSAGCQQDFMAGPTFDNVVYLDVSSRSETQITTLSNAADHVKKTLSPVLAFPEETDVNVTVEVDASLVEEYNRVHGTSWTMLDSEFYDFPKSAAVIPAGKVTCNEVLELNFRNLVGEGDEQKGALPIDETYLLPLRIVSSDISCLDGSSAAYYLVKRSSAISVVGGLGPGNWINFPSLDEYSDNSMAMNGLTAVTYEGWFYFDDFLTSLVSETNSTEVVNITSLLGVEQSLLLRIGDTNFEREQIQFDGSGSYASFGKFPKRDAGKKLEKNKWYHIAATYDQNTMEVCVYLNGKIQSRGLEMGVSVPGEDNRINLAMRALYDMYSKDPSNPAYKKYEKFNEAYQFFIGRSYNAFRPLNGKVAEVRVWSVARSEQEIWENLYKIEDPESLEELVGYWKFNEGSGNVIMDWSRYHNDGIAEKDIVWPVGIEIPVINK